MKHNRFRAICIAIVLALASLNVPSVHARSGIEGIDVAGFFVSVWYWFFPKEPSTTYSADDEFLPEDGGPCPDCQDGPGNPWPTPTPRPPRLDLE